MPEWLVERGIGEARAVLLERGAIVAARLRWSGRLAYGAVVEGVVADRFPGTTSGILRFSDGTEAFTRRLTASDSVGRPVRVAIEREAIAERGRLKRAQAVVTAAPLAPTPSLADSLRAEGHSVSEVHRFPAEADWEELFAEAWAGVTEFSGGSLLFADTPAMTVIDVDGGPPEAIFHNAVPALAMALQRFDIGGNIGIDFPTLADKGDRRAVDQRLSEALADWPHERTAMNGFGFVQIVARLRRPSLLRLIGQHRVSAAARILLRRAELVSEPGALLLTFHPAIQARLKPEWLEELARRTGREVRIATDPGLALNGAFAQAVPL
ncbi:ribonuclease E/G [Erythrobacter sp. SDW2]|uniref:ribonuclease E/G n=1 Tax=Erythrobacter sp. SDW2 TaxID=2907154 RepID=UPI001F28C480|nr:ribonuclease E/G [Erythrobacter sp. SDW2]UIP06356.1 ribonuclease E/G [Erythrobacter sp. SDW2]